MAVPSKVTVTQIQTGDPVSPTVANQPHTDLETNIDNILTYLGSGSISIFENDTTTTTGLTFGYKGGNYREDNTITTIAGSTIALTASTTNYIEIDGSGVIVKNTTGFTVGFIPLWEIVTDGSGITTLTDKRAWVVSTSAENLNFSSTALASTKVNTAIEEVNGNAIAMAVVFGS